MKAYSESQCLLKESVTVVCTGTLVSLVIKIGDVSGNGVFWLVGTLFPDFVPLKECAILSENERQEFR